MTTDIPASSTEVGALRAFVAVARAGTVGRAAAMLGRTQPSVSARLADLERVWGVRLFRRRARGMQLTAEGARLLPRAETLLQELHELERAAGVPLAGAAELRVGAGDALARELLPRALGRLAREQAGLAVRLREGPRPALLDALRAGEIDLALVTARSPAARDEGLDLVPWIESPVDLLEPSGARKTGGGRLTLRELGGAPLVCLPAESGFRAHLEAAFAARRLTFRAAIEVGNLSLVRRFVAAGLGVAPVPALAFARADRWREIRRRPIADLEPVRYARAVRAGAPLPGPVERLLAILRER